MVDLFKDIVPSILQKKEHLIQTEEDEKSYEPFLVNKALSGHQDCLFYVNEMNCNKHLDKRLQYDFLFYSIRPYKRKFQKWIKSNKDEDIELIKEYYCYNTTKAKQIYRILTEEQIDVIKQKLNKGGKIK